MNYLSGGTVCQYLREHAPIGLNEIRRIFLGFVKGVNAMAYRGFSHRDLKPDNTLLTEAGDAVIVDFGLCVKTAPGETIKEIVGTNGFMAPELKSGCAFDPMPTDMWSVGCFLVDLVYGNGTVSALFDISPENSIEKLHVLNRAMQSSPPPWQQDAEFSDPNGGSADVIYEVPLSEDTVECIGFIAATLEVDPRARLTAMRSLEHPFLVSAASAAQAVAASASGRSRSFNHGSHELSRTPSRSESRRRLKNSSEPSSPLSYREPSSPLTHQSLSIRAAGISSTTSLSPCTTPAVNRVTTSISSPQLGQSALPASASLGLAASQYLRERCPSQGPMVVGSASLLRPLSRGLQRSASNDMISLLSIANKNDSASASLPILKP